jgi:hypothetical protein
MGRGRKKRECLYIFALVRAKIYRHSLPARDFGDFLPIGAKNPH